MLCAMGDSHPVKSSRLAAVERRWPYVLVAVAFGVVKAEGITEMVRHRTGVLVVLALVAVGSLLRVRPVALAAAGGALIAVAIDPASLLVVIGLAVAGSVVIVIALLGLATLLRWQRPRRR